MKVGQRFQVRALFYVYMTLVYINIRTPVFFYEDSNIIIQFVITGEFESNQFHGNKFKLQQYDR